VTERRAIQVKRTRQVLLGFRINAEAPVGRPDRRFNRAFDLRLSVEPAGNAAGGAIEDGPHLDVGIGLGNPNLAVKNKVENSGKFSATKKRPSRNHNSPQFHHEFTIKKPRKNARFSKNPLQKHHFTTPGKKPLSILVGNPNLH
jgi:hypothetical protein